MTGFVIFVVVMIVVSLISKAKQQKTKANSAPNPRVQAVVDQIRAMGSTDGGPPLDLGPKYAKYQQNSPRPQQPQQQYQQPQYQTPQYQPGPYVAGPPLGQTSYPQPAAQQAPQNTLPRSDLDIDTQVRNLMNAKNEVAAIRLLCDERDLGILAAQEYARSLVAPAKAARTQDSDDEPEPDEDTTRYVGSAAFAESIFDLDRDEEVWASGWVDTPEVEDRSDIEELWQTVSNPPRPGATPPS